MRHVVGQIEGHDSGVEFHLVTDVVIVFNIKNLNVLINRSCQESGSVLSDSDTCNSLEVVCERHDGSLRLSDIPNEGGGTTNRDKGVLIREDSKIFDRITMIESNS